MSHASRSPWFIVQQPRSQPAVRLFCFPYAGGAASIFDPWPQDLPDWIEVWAAELPGRSTRMTERPLDGVGAIVDAMCPAMQDVLGMPYALFGHSMGALIAFDLARRLRGGGVSPLKLFVSAASAPHRKGEPPTHELPDEEFLGRVRRLSGAPPALFDNRELVSILMPRWRADFRAAETFTCSAGSPLPCPIVAFAGSDDAEVPIEAVDAWRDLTSDTFTLRAFTGGHLFIHRAQAEMTAVIAEELAAPVHNLWRKTDHVRRR